MDFNKFITKVNLHDFNEDPKYFLRKVWDIYGFDYPYDLAKHNFPRDIIGIFRRQIPFFKKYECYTYYDAIHIYGKEHVDQLFEICKDIVSMREKINLLITFNLLPPKKYLRVVEDIGIYWYDLTYCSPNPRIRTILEDNYWRDYDKNILDMF